MKSLLLLLPLLTAAMPSLAQPGPPVSLQPGAVITLPSGATPSALAIADFNQDFRLDVAVCQRGLNSVAVYLQTGGASFPNPPVGTYPVGIAPSGLVAVPFGNRINRASADLVSISGPSSVFNLLTNNTNGTGTFTPVINTGSLNRMGPGFSAVNPQLSAHDLDGNGWPDFVYTYDEPLSTSSLAGVYWKRLETSIMLQIGVQNYFRPGYIPSSFATDDFDRDGYPDVVVTNPLGNEFSVALSSGGGSPGPQWLFSNNYYSLPSTGSQPVDVTTGDVNRDQLPDIVLAHAGSTEVTVFLNLRNNQFGSQFSYPVSGAPRKVLLRDLNNDSNLDLLVLTATNQLQIFQHSGSAGAARYGTPLTLATGPNPVAMQLADMDGDGNPDVVVACAGDNTVRVFLNRSGTLSTQVARLTDVDVYPNPAHGQFTVRRTAMLRGSLTATLLDALGREVRRMEISAPTTTVPVVGLPRGVYVLHLAGATGVMNQRIVVE